MALVVSVNCGGKDGSEGAAVGVQRLGALPGEEADQKGEVLCEMETVLPFSALVKMMEPFYPQAGPSKRKATLYGLETMLRIHLMQNWWSLRDEATEEALIDTGATRPFARIDLAQDNIPDATTILAFRHFIEQHQLAEEIFKTVGQYMREKVLLLREGRVVDATIIHAPISTKNDKREGDPQMRQTHKGNQWLFGMKGQIGVDKDSGLIHSVATTSAHVSDGGMAAELLHGEEKVGLWGCRLPGP